MNAEAELPAQTADVQALEVDLSLQFVTFYLNGELFAVEMAPVQEIIRVPHTVRVPLAPSSLEGLANLRGRVLPIIQLRRIFNYQTLEHDDSTRALVIDFGSPLGFVVDRVSSVISVEPHQIEYAESFPSAIDSKFLAGVIRTSGQKSMIMILNFKQLIADEFQQFSEFSNQQYLQHSYAQASQEFASDIDEDSTDERQLVSFSVDGQEYAIDISDVQEIVQVPSDIVAVPKVSVAVLGLMTLRERLLPLVSLRTMFHLSAAELDERSRVVVVTTAEGAIGVVTDSVSEVLRVPLGLIDNLPKLLNKSAQLEEVSQICRLNEGKRLVSVIDVAKLFQMSSVRQALAEVTPMHDEEYSADESDLQDDDEEQVVIFHLGQSEFGVPIASVQEIVRIPDELTPVPKAPSFIEGIINLRGAVLPVIDQRKRLGLDTINRHDRQRIMVFELAGVRTGFIVDAVTEVLKISKQQIEPAPKLSPEQAKLLGRVANLADKKRMVQIIDPSYLIDTDEQLKVNALLSD